MGTRETVSYFLKHHQKNISNLSQNQQELTVRYVNPNF